MEDLTDTKDKFPRSGSYGSSQPGAVHGMRPAEVPPSHNTYPPQQPPSSAGMQYGAPTWHPPPSPYEGGDHRPNPPDPNQHYSHHPPHYPPPPSREHSAYGPDQAYSRTGSISGPTRSPGEGHSSQFQSVNGNPHESHYRPPPGTSDYRPPGPGYAPPDPLPNGTAPPGLHVATSHEGMSGHPQHAMHSAPHYGPPHSSMPSPSPIYGHDYYGQHAMGAYAGQRRKPVRAAQACDSCRQRKAKCDEGRPECQHCKDNNLKCYYRDVPLQKQDKQAAAITEKLDTMGENISRIMEIQENQARQFEALQNSLSLERRATMRTSRNEGVEPIARTPPVKEESIGSGQANQLTSSQKQRSKSANASGDFTMPVKHTTAVHNLLGWPSIRSLLPLFKDKEFPDSYVMDLESKRGLLRLYGCGEGEDKNDGIINAASPAGSSSNGSTHEEDSSSSTPGGVWGTGQLPARSPGPDIANRNHIGGVSADGGLILDNDLVETYYNSYMSNMHILHPFLEIRKLRIMLDKFKKRYSWGYVNKLKRKRPQDGSSPGASYEPPRALSSATGATPDIEHSIANAIVLLVLALGKICAHKGFLPGAKSDIATPTSNPQPPYNDLRSQSAPNSPSMHLGVKAGVHNPALSGPSDPRGKNMDVIPGLAYFAVAADILGELSGGTGVPHIQANLLAGLYMGQLARIFPSYSYISQACTACQVLIESKDYRDKVITGTNRNLIKLAFWSCLQLESDIRAEMSLPPSGITRHEQKMMDHGEIPDGVTLDDQPGPGEPPPPVANTPSGVIMRHYTNQIILRIKLNYSHKLLYEADETDKHGEFFCDKNKLDLIDELNKQLEEWKELQDIQAVGWSDQGSDDHKSDDINIARIRGKYYGAKYIINRPALAYALSLCPRSGSSSTPRSHPTESPIFGPGHNPQLASPAGGHTPGAGYRRQNEMGPPLRLIDRLDPRVVKAATACVWAAVRSTTAFDGIEGRLIITNIFGTAHAQFGNLLVLAAAYSSELQSLLDGYDLPALFDRTINFLKRYADISPVLEQDAEILKHVRDKLFFANQFTGPGTASSFSSS